MNSISRLVLSGLVALGASLPAVAQDGAFGSWSVACQALGPGRTICALFQRRARPDGTFAGEVQLVGLESGQTPSLAATAPLGVWLEAGMTMQVDAAAPVTAPFERCQQQGCVARFSEAALMPLLEAGRELRLTYRTGPEAAQGVTLSVSLIGVREGAAFVRGDSADASAPRKP